MQISTARPRLASLDVFRGLTIAAMVLVNNPGNWGHLYPQLDHAEWHGWTLTDWIFPFFLFIVGVSMAFSLAGKSGSKAQQISGLYRRAATIFLIGLTLNFLPNMDFSTLRIPGVLQRIALCILLTAPLIVLGRTRTLLVAILGLLAIYTGLMLGVATPGPDGIWGKGLLEAGRDTGAFVDRLLLDGHLWPKSKTWDPEGLISTLSACCNLLAGALLGRYLLSPKLSLEKVLVLLLTGTACVGLGLWLDGALMPINKSLWTTSYSVFTTGCALLVFAVIYGLVDGGEHSPVQDWARKFSQPFTIYGMNALFIFTLSSLIAKTLNAIKFSQHDGSVLTLKATLFAPLQRLAISPTNASLLYAVLFDTFLFVIAWLMWRKRWFIKV